MITCTSRLGSTALTVSTLLLLAATPAFARAADPAPAASDIRISFMVDSRLVGPTYGGERWFSQPTYTGTNGQDTVEVRAELIDAKGSRAKGSPSWISSDTEMVTVSPSQGERVKITVKRAGESKVKVVAPSVSRELVVKAKLQGALIQVEIAQGAAPKATPAARLDPPVLETQRAPGLPSEKERLSYAVGMSIGDAARKQSTDLDPALVGKGLADVLSGNKTLLSEEEARAALAEHQRQARSRQHAAQARLEQDVYAKNKREAEAFLAENAKKEGVVTLPSGLQYRILRAGDGRKPTDDDTVECNYRGTRIDGSTFDASTGSPATLKVANTIPGFREALKLMPVGSRWTIFVPPKLAYGERGVRSHKKGSKVHKIAPNTTLVFELELVAIDRSDGTSQKTAAATKPAVREN